LPDRQNEIFFAGGLDSKISVDGAREIRFLARLCQCGVIGSRHREVRPNRQLCNDGFESAILRLAQLPEPPVEINALITDIANANSTVGFYLVPPGEEKEC
jgi:hypothetical protein